MKIFLPLYESIRRGKDRNKVLWLPLFPCYVFLRGTLDRRLHVVSTSGGHMILANGGRVATIPEEEVDAIRRTIEGSLRVGPHPLLRVGDQLHVAHGTLERVDAARRRIARGFRVARPGRRRMKKRAMLDLSTAPQFLVAVLAGSAISYLQN